MTPQTTTWAAFKSLIADLYPGADGAKMFTLRDLENLVTEQALIKIRTKEDFSDYHRRFKTITVHLVSSSKLTTLEEKTEYPKGLNEKCGFCSSTGHFLRECPLVVEYIHQGRCQWNNDNKIVLPNGRFVPRRVSSQNLSERIDRWLAENGPPQQQQQQQQRPTKELEVPEVVIQRKPPTKPTSKPGPGPDSVATPSVATLSLPAKPLLPPTFKYQSMMEDPTLLQAVIDRMMNTTITLANRELCAVSSEVRKYYRENSITKRIPTVETSMIAIEEGEPAQEALVLRWEGVEQTRDHILTASPIDLLRVLDILVNDSHTIACTLDQGSEIVAMNRSVWQEIGVSLSPEKVLTMESADSNQSLMAGVVENLKFSIRDIDLLLQVHVVDGAPFDILMGRPFFRFTECHTKDRSDGTQELTLTCPNTGHIITIPTRQKPPCAENIQSTNAFSRYDVEQVGFA
ncbi:hypothetical protein B0H17DRAFT_948053 [Mycena rosella]|uniref:CCHC-type domain-containing protein n=1 Tax=Mycena rosella TaxID=1033263 RepID=A0AAD7CZQ5_MYCRO|nr:hypothetical protein B0H17DRAFT_948053 [Mycena rosella]